MGHLLPGRDLRYYPRYEGSPPRCPRLDCGLLGMKPNMPLVTLLSGAVLGVGVLVVSTVWTPSASSASGSGATSPASATTAATPPPASSASATVPATASAAAPATASATVSVTAPATAPGTAPGSAPGTAAATAPGTVPAATAPAQKADVPSKADYVAKVGGGAAVAISVHGDKAVAYICNGHAVAAWVRGTAVAGKLNLTGRNGARLSVDYRNDKAAGYIMADGTKYTFSAPMVHRVSSVHRPPGLYEATATVDGVSIKAGWVVLPDGTQVGSVEYDPTSSVPPTAQAPVLDLTTGTAQYDGVTLVASLISGFTGSGF
jgi:hypothetical protein